MTLKVYTDASYSKEADGSVIGYLIAHNNETIYYKLDFLDKVKNTEAEVTAVISAIEKCQEINKDSKIIIFTDCQKAIKMNFHNVIFQKVIGHSKKCDKDEDDIMFNIVDKGTRKRLREIVKNKKIEI